MRIRTIIAVAAVPASLAVALLGTASAASAAPASGPVPGHVQTFERLPGQLRQMPASVIPRPHLPGHLVKNGSSLVSSNWSGYADQACSTCHLRFVSSDFTVPSVNTAEAAGTSDVYWASHWVGLDGFSLSKSNSTVEQTGIDATVENGTVVYYAWYEMYPANPVVYQLAAQPGDNIAVSVYYNQSSKLWQLTLDDTTQNAGFVTNQAAVPGFTPANQSAEVISEDPGGAVQAGYDLLDFGQVNFNNSEVTSYNGTHGTLGNGYLWTSYPVTMANGTDTMAVPSGLVNGVNVNGTPISDFEIYWHASS